MTVEYEHVYYRHKVKQASTVLQRDTHTYKQTDKPSVAQRWYPQPEMPLAWKTQKIIEYTAPTNNYRLLFHNECNIKHPLELSQKSSRLSDIKQPLAKHYTKGIGVKKSVHNFETRTVLGNTITRRDMKITFHVEDQETLQSTISRNTSWSILAESGLRHVDKFDEIRAKN